MATIEQLAAKQGGDPEWKQKVTECLKEKVIRKQGLDPDWKEKLTDCMKEIGLLSAPFLQVTVNVADYRVCDVTKQERLK